MQKAQLIELLAEYGDAVINYRSPNSNKPKYVVGTTDFTTAYIADRINELQNKVVTGDDVIIFCWDNNAFRTIHSALVTSVTPLSAMLKNDPA